MTLDMEKREKALIDISQNLYVYNYSYIVVNTLSETTLIVESALEKF
jgi:hypothetical protein